MRKKWRAFTLLETLLVVGVVLVLAVLAILALDPFEQLKKASDFTLRNLCLEIFNASIRWYSIKNRFLSTSVDDFLKAAVAKTYLDELINSGELKKDFFENLKNNNASERIKIIGDEQKIVLCFKPVSKAFKLDKTVVFNSHGEKDASCPGGSDCFWCVGKESGETTSLSSSLPIPSPTTDPCSDFDPAYPPYPWTCNYAEKFKEFGCDHFCVTDGGCYTKKCPFGRELVKGYSGPNIFLCPPIIFQESYCMPKDDRCFDHYWRSSPYEFEWGCSNPIRPIRWLK